MHKETTLNPATKYIPTYIKT